MSNEHGDKQTFLCGSHSPVPLPNKTHRRRCKMSSSKKLTCKGLCCRYLSARGPEPHPKPPPSTLYTCIQYRYLITQWRGEGGRVATDREEVRGATVHKVVENTNMINNCRKAPLQVTFFKMTTFYFGVYIVNKSMAFKTSNFSKYLSWTFFAFVI